MTLSSFSAFSQHLAWENIVEQEYQKEVNLKRINFPHSFYFDWKNKYGISPRDNDGIWGTRSVKRFNCKHKKLIPTHKGMDQKVYHLFEYRAYDNRKIPGTAYECLVKSNGPKKYCLRADTLNRVLMSDLYRDKCGNFYRGVIYRSFLTDNESMGTLFTPGRTAYPKPNSPYNNDYRPGDTYEVDKNEFLLFMHLTKKEREKISHQP